MAAIKIALDNENNQFRPGEAIQGRAAWHFDDPPDSVELRILWSTMGKGTVDISVVESIPLQGEGNWGDAPFAINAPSAPWSCNGTLVSIHWALELVALPSNDFDSVEIVIAPDARPIRLSGFNADDVDDADLDTADDEAGDLS